MNRASRLRHLISLLRPYRGRVMLMFVSLVIATAAALAPPYLAGRAIDDGIKQQDMNALTVIVIAFVAAAILNWAASYLQTYLINWVGQRALQDLRVEAVRAPPAPLDRLLLAQQGGRADLAPDERRPGARPARDRGHLDPLLGHAHARRHRGDPRRARPGSRADHLPHLPGPARGERGVPVRVRRGVPANPREDRARHRVPPGDALRACAWCARSARSRGTAAASRS